MTINKTDKLLHLLNRAEQIALSWGHPAVGPEHVLVALCADNENAAKFILYKMHVDLSGVERVAMEFLGVRDNDPLLFRATPIRPEGNPSVPTQPDV